MATMTGQITCASRFTAMPRWAALAILGGVALMISAGYARPTTIASTTPPVAQSTALIGDEALYATIADKVTRGEPYYRAAIATQRQSSYAVRPFLTVRMPALAELFAVLGGSDHAKIVFYVLMLAAGVAMIRRLDVEAGYRPVFAMAVAAVVFPIAAMRTGNMHVWHESWAGLLLVLGLALRQRSRWLLSLICILAASMIRELAAPMLAVMAVAAWHDGARTEAAAWCAALASFAVALGIHAATVTTMTNAGDMTSPGWSAFGGWAFVLAVARNCTGFAELPSAIIPVVVPLALLGWAGWRSATGLRGGLYVSGMIAAFTLFGRPDNVYWGVMLMALLPLGLAFAPRALIDLIGIVRTSPRPAMSERLLMR
jgi:hypothetical protein